MDFEGNALSVLQTYVLHSSLEIYKHEGSSNQYKQRRNRRNLQRISRQKLEYHAGHAPDIHLTKKHTVIVEFFTDLENVNFNYLL